MSRDDEDVDIAEPRSMTLHNLYRSTQGQLVQAIEKCLDLGKKNLAARLDGVLLRQRFWEEDIGMGDGTLSNLEAKAEFASSIIRHYLDRMVLLLSDINGTIAGSHIETDKEDETISLLYETNTRLCDQVEIFDAIAVIDTADAAADDGKATAMRQLRRQLEDENQRLHNRSKMPLRLLYSPQEVGRQAGVDIVAVHGLNPGSKPDDQHALDSWRTPLGDNWRYPVDDKGQHWLRDVLPRATPLARIFLYEYNTIQAFAINEGEFVDKADELLKSIHYERSGDRNRPLIFLARDFGSILVLQSLNNASTHSKYMSIVASKANLIFFSPPRGRTAAAVAKALHMQGYFIETLVSGGLFTDLVRRPYRYLLERYQVVTFQEGIIDHEPERKGFEFTEREEVVRLDDLNDIGIPYEKYGSTFSAYQLDLIGKNFGIVSAKVQDLYEDALTRNESGITFHQMVPSKQRKSGPPTPDVHQADDQDSALNLAAREELI